MAVFCFDYMGVVRDENVNAINRRMLVSKVTVPKSAPVGIDWQMIRLARKPSRRTRKR